MSLSLHEPLRVGFCPDRLVLTGVRGRWRRRTAQRLTVPLAPAPGARPWEAALAALPDALARMNAAGSYRVVLSNFFVRYALLPWNAALRTTDEWRALAAHRFESIHGPAAADWEIRVAKTAARGPRIAAAMDRALFHALPQAAGSADIELTSIEPYLFTAFNQARKHLGRGRHWLVAAEPGRLALALLEQGNWRALRCHAVGMNWREELDALLDRESALLALDQPYPEAAVIVERDGAPVRH